jgi:type I restriction enzyme M protein
MAQYSNIHRPNVSFVWNITDVVLRDTFKKSEIGDVLLPFVVLRRMDCILAPYNKKVREQYEQFKDKISLEKLDPLLRKTAGGLKFYNTSRHTLLSLQDDAKNISVNFANYIAGFNGEVQHIFECFQFDKVVVRLNRNNLLYKMLGELTALDFSPEKVDNHDMGYIFEELIRIANDQSNEQAGEHFTPRDVIRLMSAILFTPDADELRQSGIIRTIYDPACGTGGMVNVGKRYILEDICADSDAKPTINTFGQELNEQSYAIAKSETLVAGENSDNIQLGNTFTEDHFQGKRFNYIMANPPYGVTWRKDQEFILEESQNPEGRFYAGTPRTSDGQLLFVQHMLSKMKPEGSRVGVVTNGSPLFSGGAGSGESNIRKWIIENDWLECIVALPKDLFYNTGIATYLWFFTNKKSAQRRGKVQLINAVDFCKPCSKSLGNKRNDILEEHVQKALRIYLDFEENEYCKIFNNKNFGQYELTIEQPQRDAEGNLVLNRSGKKQADASKRDTEKVALDCDWKKYFDEEVLPHIDPESWVELSKTRKLYEINFTKYFYTFQQQEPSADIAARIMQREKNVAEMIKSIFED